MLFVLHLSFANILLFFIHILSINYYRSSNVVKCGREFKYEIVIITIAVGHTMSNAPDPIRTPKLSGIRQG